MRVARTFSRFLLLTLSTLTAAQQQRPAGAPPPTQPAQTHQSQAARTTADAQTAAPAQPIVLRGGRLLTVTKGIIENGVLVIDGGKIAAIGAAGAVNAPRNAKVIDVSGMTVYPGLIDSNSQLGLTEISAVEMTNDLVEPSDAIMPHMRVQDAFHAESELIPVTRINGITNAIVSPTERDTLPGQVALIQLDGRDRDEMLKWAEIALPLNFTGRQRRNESFETAKFPQTRMGMAAQLRQAFIDAQEYAQKNEDYERKKQTPARQSGQKSDPDAGPPKRDLKLEAMLPYLQGKKPVVVTAEKPSDIKVAMKLAQEFNLKVILQGVQHGQLVFDEIARWKVPVIVGSIYDAPKSNDRYDAQFRVPAELRKRGVKIAFASYDAHNVRNLPYAAGYAVAYGLPQEEALKALTIYPAEIWGVADQLGSLEVGKAANVVVANGDPLDVRTDVKRVFIAGREVPMKSHQTELRDAYMRR